MKALAVIGAIALVLVLIGLIPLALDIVWRPEDFRLTVRLWLLSVSLPRQKRKRDRPDDAEKKRKKKRPDLREIKSLAKNGYNTLCWIVSRIRMDIMKIHFTAAWPDPAVTAMAYAAAGTAMDGILHVGGRSVAHADLLANVDFERESPVMDLHLRFSARLHMLVAGAVRFGVGFLKDHISHRREVRRSGKSSSGRHDGNGDG